MKTCTTKLYKFLSNTDSLIQPIKLIRYYMLYRFHLFVQRYVKCFSFISLKNHSSNKVESFLKFCLHFSNSFLKSNICDLFMFLDPSNKGMFVNLMLHTKYKDWGSFAIFKASCTLAIWQALTAKLRNHNKKWQLKAVSMGLYHP